MDFKEYWENYYAKHKVPQGNSQFAEFVLNNYLKQDGRKICDLRLLELGGGMVEIAYFLRDIK